MHPKSNNVPRPAATANLLTTQARFQQALAFHQRGLLKQAQAAYQDLLKTQPRHFHSLHLLGVIAIQTNKPQRAVALIDQAIAIHPNDAAFYYNRGTALNLLGQLGAAVASFDQAIAVKPDYVHAYCNRGNALQQLKQLEAALASFDQAIAIQPDYADAWSNRGNVLRELKQLDAAVASFDQAISIQPGYAQACYNRGIALQDLKQPGAAVASFDRAIAIQPDYAQAYCNRGNALQELKQFEAAIASFDRAIAGTTALQPEHAIAWYNRGNALKELGKIDAAVASYDKAIAVQPDYAQAYWNKALSLLLAADFANGLKLYEWRWRVEETGMRRRHYSQPLWSGKEALTGKTILLYGEQGLGDTLQFCRYAKMLADLGARVILEVKKPLEDLLKNLAGVSELVVADGTAPAFDFHCPLLSLPLAFQTDLKSIPNSPRYLYADVHRVVYWAQRLGAKTGPRVGVVWSGNAEHKNDFNRSVVLSSLLRHLPHDCQYVSLQIEVRDVDRPTLQARAELLHFGDELGSFADTAALCELMDLVISVDTSVAHLSAALGRPTWLLLPFSPDWRWLLDRADSPWYPSLTLYRQAQLNAWDNVFQRVAFDLKKWCQSLP